MKIGKVKTDQWIKNPHPYQRKVPKFLTTDFKRCGGPYKIDVWGDGFGYGNTHYVASFIGPGIVEYYRRSVESTQLKFDFEKTETPTCQDA